MGRKPKSGGEPGQNGTQDDQPSQAAATQVAGPPDGPAGAAAVIPANLIAALESLAAAGGVPVNLQLMHQARIDTAKRLNAKPRLTVLFPPCSNELLALINPADQDEVTGFFNEYFKFRQHLIFGVYQTGNSPHPVELADQLRGVLAANLLHCGTGSGPVILSAPAAADPPAWPSECCVCNPCVTLDGNRNPTAPGPQLPNPVVPSLQRLFIGDTMFLFWLGERLGIFQVLGAILDAFATNGTIPISNGSLDPAEVRDDVTAIVLEVMVRLMKQGLASSARERAAAYRVTLGWNSPAGQQFKLETQVNSGFNTQFHKFIYNALEFYRDRRLAVAIRGSAAPAPPASVATLITISDTIDVLKKRFETWEYGRNMYNTLNGIVWMIAAMSVIRELRTTLGIPPAFSDPHEYIPAAYDLLVGKRPITHGSENRYVLHRELAKNGRDLLLDLEVIDHRQRDPGGELDCWLTQVEAKIEAYRTAYRTITNVDLGASGSPAIEQQA